MIWILDFSIIMDVLGTLRDRRAGFRSVRLGSALGRRLLDSLGTITDIVFIIRPWGDPWYI